MVISSEEPSNPVIDKFSDLSGLRTSNISKKPRFIIYLFSFLKALKEKKNTFGFSVCENQRLTGAKDFHLLTTQSKMKN